MTRSRRRSHIKRAKVLHGWTLFRKGSEFAAWSASRPRSWSTPSKYERRSAQMAQAMRGYYHD